MKKLSSPSRKKPVSKCPFPIVGIGASAGGLEAITALLGQIPPDTGMAFVVVQHLEPHYKSRLTELLARITSLPVHEGRNRMAVERDHVYVIPPNKYMGITQGHLTVVLRPPSLVTPLPIDFFLNALSAECGAQATGVILSGSGADGTLGLGTIKSGGGITFAQDPATAKFDAMPQSAIGSGFVDFVLPPAGIAQELSGKLLHRTADLLEPSTLPPKGWDLPGAQNQIFFMLRRATGVDFSRYKQSTINRRIARRVLVTRSENVQAYVACLKTQPKEITALFNDLLITVTRFFREPASLEFLRKKVFPALLKGRRIGQPLRIWVPGCSSGEEVYSLAMVLTEFLGEKIADYPVQIFGTDINEAAIAQARSGLYPPHSLATVPPRLLKRYFTPVEGKHRIDRHLRDMCVFARQDITTDPPFSQLDLISCQNMLIYFEEDLQNKVLRVLHYALKPNAWLILSPAETPGKLSPLFTQQSRSHKIYAKIWGDTEPSLPAPPGPPAARSPSPPLKTPKLSDAPALNVERAADRLLLDQFAPSGVVIDEHFHILQFRGHTAPYLKHPQGAAALDLLKLVDRQVAIPLRIAILRAFRDNVAVRKDYPKTGAGGSAHTLTIHIIPFKLAPADKSYGLVLFSAPAGLPPTLTPIPVAAGGKKTPPEMRILIEELESTRSSLQAIIEEQEATNEELQSANEEIQSANEELQSTNEELETSKEELQSTNEELRTVNEELGQSNLLANRITNDLLNLLASVQIPVVMVDNTLAVRRFTPLAQKFFNLITSDIGRSISDIRTQLQVEDLEEMIQEVIATLHLKEREVQDRHGHWFSLRIRPYRTQDNVIDGAVLALIDIHDLKHAQTRKAAPA